MYTNSIFFTICDSISKPSTAIICKKVVPQDIDDRFHQSLLVFVWFFCSKRIQKYIFQLYPNLFKFQPYFYWTSHMSVLVVSDRFWSIPDRFLVNSGRFPLGSGRFVGLGGFILYWVCYLYYTTLVILH